MGHVSHEFTTKDRRIVRLRQAVEDDAIDLVRAVDSVSRERAYFLRSRFEVDEETERNIIAESAERGDLILLALAPGRLPPGNTEELAGWLTLFRGRPEFLRHTGELGMGVVRGYRGLGIGSALIEYALRWAAQVGLEKVQLGVRATNERARALYLRFGFAEEGYRVREVKDPQSGYDDCIEMALFVPHARPTPEGGGEGRSGA